VECGEGVQRDAGLDGSRHEQISDVIGIVPLCDRQGGHGDGQDRGKQGHPLEKPFRPSMAVWKFLSHVALDII
jgi:hypothetical protein